MSKRREEVLEALQLCDKAIDNLLPGAKHIVADAGLINEALLASRRVQNAEPEEDPAALREAAREVLRALDPLNVNGVPVLKLDSRLDMATGELAKQINAAPTFEEEEARCDAWLTEEGLSFASPEAWWATKVWMKARGFDWTKEEK